MYIEQRSKAFHIYKYGTEQYTNSKWKVYDR